LIAKVLKRLTDMNNILSSNTNKETKKKEEELIKDLANKEILLLLKDLAYKSKDIRDAEFIEEVVRQYNKIQKY